MSAASCALMIILTLSTAVFTGKSLYEGIEDSSLTHLQQMVNSVRR